MCALVKIVWVSVCLPLLEALTLTHWGHISIGGKAYMESVLMWLHTVSQLLQPLRRSHRQPCSASLHLRGGGRKIWWCHLYVSLPLSLTLSLSLFLYLSLFSSLRGCVVNVMVLSAARATWGRSFIHPLPCVPAASVRCPPCLCVLWVSL